MAIQQQPESSDASRRVENRGWVDPAVWQREDMRLALAIRDIGTVYRLLQRYGVSQRRIAALTEQTQGGVSEIIAGRRLVVSYDLLIRIADGLGIPRGWLGLAHDRPSGGGSHEA